MCCLGSYSYGFSVSPRFFASGFWPPLKLFQVYVNVEKSMCRHVFAGLRKKAVVSLLIPHAGIYKWVYRSKTA